MSATSQPLAVVPVMVNAGAALLPALIATAGSILGLLFRPRALVFACRQRPMLAGGIVVVVGVITTLACVLYKPASARAATSSGIDWPALAREIQREQATPHALFAPLWTSPLDDEMALATPALFQPPVGGGDPILYQPAIITQSDKLLGTLHALDARTGKKIWQASSFANVDGTTSPRDLRPIFSQPTLAAAGTRLITGQGLHDDANCALLCFDIAASQRANAGRTDWAVPTDLHLESSPALFTVNGHERVVIGAGAIEGPDKKPISHPGYVICVDVSTGKLLWRHDVNDPEAAPVVDEQKIVYVGSGFNGNAVVALRTDTDAELRARNLTREVWRTPTIYPATGDLALAHDPALGDLVLLGVGNGDYIHSDKQPAGRVIALERATGKILWRFSADDSVLGRIAVSGQTVLAPCRDGNAYALDLTTGARLWKSRVAQANDIPVTAGLVTDGRYAFALAADATLAAFNLDTGTLIERLSLNDPNKVSQNYTMATPLLAGSTLYVPTENGGLRVFHIAQ